MICDLTRPCDDCPFLRKGGIRLHLSRISEIAKTDGFFLCHKTVTDCDAEDEERPRTGRDNEKMCAGLMILREKIEHPNQMMRIAERLGMYNPERLMADPSAIDLVFDDIDEMLECNARSL